MIADSKHKTFYTAACLLALFLANSTISVEAAEASIMPVSMKPYVNQGRNRIHNSRKHYAWDDHYDVNDYYGLDDRYDWSCYPH